MYINLSLSKCYCTCTHYICIYTHSHTFTQTHRETDTKSYIWTHTYMNRYTYMYSHRVIHMYKDTETRKATNRENTMRNVGSTTQKARVKGQHGWGGQLDPAFSLSLAALRHSHQEIILPTLLLTSTIEPKTKLWTKIPFFSFSDICHSKAF